MSSLEEKQHVGVLGGFPLTDVRILIASGRAHLKHTEGGDFREASWRAVRQGLMHAENVLLEPFYNYRLIVPSELVGRAINDIRTMSGDFNPEQMPDGNTVTTTLYEAAGFEIALTDAPSTYPEMFASSSSESASAGSDTSVSDAPKTYTIYKDPEGKFVYVNSTSCNSDEGDRLAEDMTLALNETGAETVIFDVRSNGGGVTGFCNRQVLPALFSHDLEYPTDCYGIKNDFTKCFYNDLYYRIYFERPIKVEGDNYFVHEDFNVEGKAAKNCKIYLLTSYSTFSSADLMTCLCKAYDNATVVGTNTGGEGICGTPFHSYLPNSHFMFNYTSTVNVNVPENNFMGTSPDIYIPYTVEEFCKRSELLNQGLDVNSFEVRMMYDKTLNYVVDLAANG